MIIAPFNVQLDERDIFFFFFFFLNCCQDLLRVVGCFFVVDFVSFYKYLKLCYLYITK